MNIDRSKPSLRVCADVGTANLSANTQHVYGPYTAKTAPIRGVLLKANDSDLNVKQVAILEPNGNVISGAQEVDQFLSHNPQAANRTLRLWKLKFIPHFRHHKQVRHNRRILHGEKDAGYIRDFLADHLRCILNDVRSFYKREVFSDDPTECAEQFAYIDSLPIELQLPVPVMMDDDGRTDFRIAARLAGAIDVELREEPLCVATRYMLELIKVKHNPAEEGQNVLVMDVGGGTADVTTVDLPTPGNDESLVIERIGLCDGNGAGSQCLEAQAERWALQQPWLEQKCSRLQINVYNFLCQLSKGMESVKRHFYNERQSYTIMIHSSHGISGDPLLEYEFPLSIRRTIIQGWYDEWIGQVKDLLRGHLSTRRHLPYALAILSGGGSKSAFLRREITEFLHQEYGIKTQHTVTVAQPCSEGGLTQHVLQNDALPDPCHWYIAQSEPYNSKRHLDARRCARLRQKSAYVDGEILVHDRLIRLMSYARPNGFQPRRPLLQRFAIEVGPLGRLHLLCFWSEKRRAEHPPACDLNGVRKQGLRSYPVMFDLPDLRPHHFAVHDDGGKHYHLVLAFIEMHGDESSLRVTATVMKPAFSEGDAFDEQQVWDRFTDEIWTPSSSPFVSQHTGSSGARCRSDYRQPQGVHATTEGRTQRLRSVSVLASEYGGAGSSDDETPHITDTNAARKDSAHAGGLVASTSSSRKRTLEESQSTEGRHRGGRQLVRQESHAPSPAHPHSAVPPRYVQNATRRSSVHSPSAADSPYSGESLYDIPSLSAFLSPTAAASPEPVDRSIHSSNTARSFSSRSSPGFEYSDTDVLLRKCEE